MTDFEPRFADADAETPGDPPAAARNVEYHWLRGALWGLCLGIGLAIYALIFRVIELQLATMGIIVALGIVIGLLWSRFGPVKA
jgi:hypothetical protein